MIWFKDQIIEQESERLADMWTDNFMDLQEWYPDFDKLPMYASELHPDLRDGCYCEVERRVMDGFADAADNLRKREMEN